MSSTIYQPKDAKLTDCTIEMVDGVICINPGGPSSPGAGTRFSWDISGPSDLLTVRWNNPGATARAFDVSIGGNSIGSISCPAGASAFNSTDLKVSLLAGIATILFTAGQSGGANVASLAVNVPAVSPAPASPPATISSAVDYVIASIWPHAQVGLKATAFGGIALPLPSNTFTINPTALRKATNFKPISGTPANPTQYDGLWITNNVRLDNFHDIIFTNCRIDAGRRGNGWTQTVAGDYWCIKCANATNIVIRHCELCNSQAAAIEGDGFTAEYNLIHHCGADALKPGRNCAIRYNYIAFLAYANTAAHADGLQTLAGHDVVIEYNFFDLDVTGFVGFKANTIYQLQANPSGLGNYNIIFRRNWCRGSANGLHMYNFVGGKEKSIQVVENILIGVQIHIGTGATVSGNVDLAGHAVAA